MPIDGRLTLRTSSFLPSTSPLLLPFARCCASCKAPLLLPFAKLGSCCSDGALLLPVASLDGCCCRWRGAGPPGSELDSQLGTSAFSVAAAASLLAPLLGPAAWFRALAGAATPAGPSRLALPGLSPKGSPLLDRGVASALNAGLCTTLKSADGGCRALPAPPTAKAGVCGVDDADEPNIMFVQVVAASGWPSLAGDATAVDATFGQVVAANGWPPLAGVTTAVDASDACKAQSQDCLPFCK